MNLVKFRGMPSRRSEQMNSVFDDFFRRGISDFFQNNWLTSSPSVNVSAEEGAYLIDLAAPGLHKEDFSIDLKDNTLIVKVSNRDKEEATEENYVRREFNYSAFERQFQVPEDVDTEAINASYKEGILHITMPRVEGKEDEHIKRIEIA